MHGRNGIFKMAGYSWRCVEHGAYGSDWVSEAASPVGQRDCKRDAEAEFAKHLFEFHEARAPQGEAGRD